MMNTLIIVVDKFSNGNHNLVEVNIHNEKNKVNSIKLNFGRANFKWLKWGLNKLGKDKMNDNVA